MKLLIIGLLMFPALVFAQSFPKGPDARLTLGALCDMPVEYRYPEHIAYCGRDVDTVTKNEIFVSYRQLGYSLPSQSRADYKIDHYIPLCMGGANSKTNLWPQHISIYKQTDTLEEAICSKMRDGKMSQAAGVKMMKAVKNNLSLIPQAWSQLNSL
jgi:hypothetical protein